MRCFILILLSLVSLSAVAAQLQKAASFRVALVDKFYSSSKTTPADQDTQDALHGLLDLDGDQIKEPFYHGDLVRMIATDPDIAVLPYAIRPGERPLNGLLRNLQDIRRDIFWGEQIDAVLLPWESSTLVSAFEDTLRVEHLDAYMKTLEEWASRDPIWEMTWEIILVLEDIVDYGGLVFTIAGNGGPRMVNTYSFAEGVVTVGAAEPELQHFVSNNAFVDMYDKAAYVPVRVDDISGVPQGYDLNNDGCTDIDIADISSRSDVDLPRVYWKVLKGSSFAAPAALKRSLLNEVDRGGCVNQHTAFRALNRDTPVTSHGR